MLPAYNHELTRVRQLNKRFGILLPSTALLEAAGVILDIGNKPSEDYIHRGYQILMDITGRGGMALAHYTNTGIDKVEAFLNAWEAIPEEQRMITTIAELL